MTEMLRALEEALIERKALLECICMPPVLNSHAAACDAVIAALQGQASQGATLASWLHDMGLERNGQASYNAQRVACPLPTLTAASCLPADSQVWCSL